MVPQHTHPSIATFSEKAKYLLLVEERVASIPARLQPTGSRAFWPQIEARAFNVRYPHIAALATSVDREWMAMRRN